MGDAIERAKQFLFGRQTAYRAVFTGPMSDVVLADLAKFCRDKDSTFHPDPRVAAQLDGRREVFLRISQHLKLSSDDLWKLYQVK
jgi:hypothetical protein